LSARGDPPVPRWLATGAGWAWRLLLLAGSLYVLGVVFERLQVVIVPVVAALFATTILGPPAQWLRRHGWPSILATWAVFLLAVGVVVGVVFGIIPGVKSEFSTLGRDFNSGINSVEHWLEHGPLHISRHDVSSYVSTARRDLLNNQAGLLSGALSGVTMVLEVVAGLLLSVVLTFFFVKDSEQMSRWALGLVSERRARDLRGLGRELWRVLTGYLRGTAVNGVVNACLLAVALLALGVPLVAALALLTFIGGFVPLVGAILSGLVAALVALVSHGPIAALIIVGVTVVIHNVEGYLVGPLVLGRAVRLHPVAIILALAVGTIVGGIVGTFLAVPVLAIVITLFHHYRRGILSADAGTEGARPGQEGIPAPSDEGQAERPMVVEMPSGASAGPGPAGVRRASGGER
jgi:putative heme transporter